NPIQHRRGPSRENSPLSTAGNAAVGRARLPWPGGCFTAFDWVALAGRMFHRIRLGCPGRADVSPHSTGLPWPGGCFTAFDWVPLAGRMFRRSGVGSEARLADADF